MKVVVLGSGVIGVTTAYYLARAGAEVTVIDRQDGPALDTSFANAGQVSFGYSTPWGAPGIPMKALKWMFEKHAPLSIRPDGSLFQLRWMAQMLRNCSTERYAVNKERMLRLSNYSRQCILAALRHHNGVLDVHAVQDAADEFGLGEVEFFAGVCDPQFFFCGHSDFDDVCLSFSRRVIAVLLCVYVRTFHFSHIRPPVKMINARSGMERAM